MSSAAVQASQHYTPEREYYASNAGNLSSSPPSSRRTDMTGGNYGTYQSPTQQQQYASPSSSAAMSTPRGPTGYSANQSPSSGPLSSSTYQQFYPDQGSPGPGAALPIRTSSQQAPTSATAPAYDSRAYASRPQQPASGYGSESERERASDNERRQRASQQSPSTQGSATKRSRQAPTQSRSATAVGQPPMDTSLPRENSAIITHIVVDDPQADVARERARVAEAKPNQQGSSMPSMVDQTIPADPDQKQRSRQEHLKQPSHRKELKFGDYILGQTLGEGEFGKVKMGWKKDSTVQVAIKLIRKESLQGHQTRLPKIYREIGILRDLQHPNIVRLHEFVETERHMGIILEYASGGELFDYILNNRYLKDPAARRLFAQLVSGVGYLHKKGIVHRDLKLENLLLDRNKNIIITDFGFANTFNPNDELGEDLEHRITDKDFVKREGLDKTNADGKRRGDLMQTSCGSPCYAAPELVVSDGLYTGRKVDVWSCGVILYAMLAGYLPFDDDPANPEGDNINLLYKYIVHTPLTFPEYVSPHARDLLKRILVPDPRQRADLFEVARHSWLSEYSHVVGFIGSSTKSDLDIAASAMRQSEEPSLGRSASVREPASKTPTGAGAAPKQAAIAGDAETEPRSTTRDAKRRTVQVEYVAPKDSTTRGDASPAVASAAAAAAAAAVPTSAGRTRARGDASGPTEVTPNTKREVSVPRKEVPSPQAMPPPVRPGREQTRAASDSPALSQPYYSASRPNTSGTLGSARLPSRGNCYSQPAIPTPTNANAQGHMSQPSSSSGYIISSPMQQDQTPDGSRAPSQQNLAQYQQQEQPPRGHKRSSTLGSIGDRVLGRTNSRRASQQQQEAQAVTNEKRDRKYPPVSMRNAMPNSNDEVQPRTSTESSRRTSFGFSRKNSDVPSEKRSSRRFSFLPSMSSFTGKKDPSYDSRQSYQGRPESKGMAFGQGRTPSDSSETDSTIPMYYEHERETNRLQKRSGPPQQQSRGPYYEKALPPQPQPAQSQPLEQSYAATPPPIQRKQYRDDGYGNNLLDPTSMQQQEPVERYWTPTESSNRQPVSPPPVQYDNYNYSSGGNNGQYQPPPQSSGNYSSNAYENSGYQDSARQQMRPNQRKFADQYEHGNSGSSSATRRVMDFFRRRGKDRSEV